MAVKAGIKEGRTVSAADYERLTQEEGEAIHGKQGWLDCVLKAMTPHDSRRHVRNIQKNEKAMKKKQLRRGETEEED